MHDIYVRDIISISNGKLICGDINQKLNNFSIDTRLIKPNDVYVGLIGDKSNGSDYYLDAIKKGASVCIVNKDVEPLNNSTIVKVDDTLKCLQDLASYKRSLYDIPVIAVTGSAGKTSTKDLIASVIEEKYKTHKTTGNYNNHIGVPLTILSLKDEEVLVLEMGMNHLGEISLLSNIAKPTISVITNVGTAHIGNLGSRENILKAKLEILDGMIGKDIILNIDNDMLNSSKNKLKESYNVHTISIDNDSDLKSTNICEKTFSSTFKINDKIVKINVGGKVFIYNALIAYKVGLLLNIEEKKIIDGINNFKLSSHRLERKKTKNGITIIDDTYNANYDSMKSSIELLGKVNEKRKVAIIGDMLELGDFSEDLHKQIGQVLIENKIDLVITIGKYTKVINILLKLNNIESYHFDKENKSYELLDKILNKDDIILIKGSHSINLINIVDYLIAKED